MNPQENILKKLKHQNETSTPNVLCFQSIAETPGRNELHASSLRALRDLQKSEARAGSRCIASPNPQISLQHQVEYAIPMKHSKKLLGQMSLATEAYPRKEELEDLANTYGHLLVQKP